MMICLKIFRILCLHRRKESQHGPSDLFGDLSSPSGALDSTIYSLLCIYALFQLCISVFSIDDVIG